MRRIISLLLASIMLLSLVACGSNVNEVHPITRNESELADQPLKEGEMRRPLSNESPMLIVHIDTWNYPDPQKIIDLIPEDILPFCVFNISLSVSHDEETGEFHRTGTPYELCKSWIRTCAENNVFCMVQPASGGWSNLPDYDLNTDYEETLYAEFFRDYPNFLGFNYCEQFWGFDQVNGSLTSPTVAERYDHLSKLLELADKYGGYVIVSWCGNQWGQWLNPTGILKSHEVFKETLTKYSDHFILCDKYTQGSYKHDVQSQVLGYYLSGYCGNFGVRYDETAWSDHVDGEYTISTGFSTMLESMLLSGATVIDGPELIWADNFKEVSASETVDGYTQRNWETYIQYRNSLLDMFRKVTDGTLYIPTREEVLDRVKVAIIQDVEEGDDDAKYCTPKTLFEGLYRMENDGNLRENYYHYKTNGRYPTIPLIVDFKDPMDEFSIENLIRASEYDDLFKTTSMKVDYFNEIFPEEYTGDLYAGRFKNTWYTYSYYLRREVGNATLNLKYNTCDTLGLSYSNYSSGIITEYSDHIDFYLNNFDENNEIITRDDVITITGATEKPTYTYSDRGKQMPTKIKEDWSNGVYTLTVSHNGPVDLTINCKGSATDRSTDYAQPKIVTPEFARNYYGDLQYEGECFDYVNVTKCMGDGYNTGVKDYTGQGYMNFGNKDGASVRDIVTVREKGEYNVIVRYTATSDIENCVLEVNGKKYKLSFAETLDKSEWMTAEVPVSLNLGANEIRITANGELEGNLLIDNIVISKIG